MKRTIKRTYDRELHNKRALFIQKLLWISFCTLLVGGITLIVGTESPIVNGTDTEMTWVLLIVGVACLVGSYLIYRFMKWALD